MKKNILVLLVLLASVALTSFSKEKPVKIDREIISWDVPAELTIVDWPIFSALSSDHKWLHYVIAMRGKRILGVVDIENKSAMFKTETCFKSYGQSYNNELFPVYSYPTKSGKPSCELYDISTLTKREVEIPSGNHFSSITGLPLILIKDVNHKTGDVGIFNFKSGNMTAIKQSSHGMNKLETVNANSRYLFLTGLIKSDESNLLCTKVFDAETNQLVFEDSNGKVAQGFGGSDCRPSVLDDHVFSYYSSAASFVVYDLKNKKRLYEIGDKLKSGSQQIKIPFGTFNLPTSRIKVKDGRQSGQLNNLSAKTGKLIWVESIDGKSHFTINSCNYLTGKERISIKLPKSKYSSKIFFVKIKEDWYFATESDYKTTAKSVYKKIHLYSLENMHEVKMTPIYIDSLKHSTTFADGKLYILSNEKLEIVNLIENLAGN